MALVKHAKFNKKGISEIQDIKCNWANVGKNWPVVYVLNNKKEAYVGETVNAARRMDQHMKNKNKEGMTDISIISDEDFNKSAILDLEAFLITHMSADGKYKLLNGNNGIRDHEYYNKDLYHVKFENIWNKLKKEKIVNNTLKQIESSELFKYSPYKSLGDDQSRAINAIIGVFADNRNTGSSVSVIVKGGAGTGKTILAVFIMKLISDINKRIGIEMERDEFMLEEPVIVSASEGFDNIKKIGIVFPQEDLKRTMQKLFKSIKSLESKMVYSPNEVVDEYLRSNEKFDLLIVDESHRLKCRNHGHLSYYPAFDTRNEKLHLDPNMGNELDWVLKCSKNQIFFRDELQTIRPCDIYCDEFYSKINNLENNTISEVHLDTQWRCKGGNDYINYVRNILSGCQEKPEKIGNYEFLLFDDVNQMIEAIKDKDTKHGLCRNLAGFAWKWISKDDKSLYDIEIQKYKYRWNSDKKNWITTEDAINEIGCIHRVQGFDLSYAGVIIGEDIKYDPQNKKIYADKNCYFDQQGKSGVAEKPEELKEYLINIYLTLMTRGIYGTYVYVCDDNLREYMRMFIPTR